MSYVTSTRTVRTVHVGGDGGTTTTVQTFGGDGGHHHQHSGDEGHRHLISGGHTHIRTIKMSGRYQKGWQAPQDKRNVTRVARAGVQNYDQIKKECLASGTLWEDPEFPAENDRSIGTCYRGRNFEWKRPTEIVSEPHMFVGGATRFDIKQGDIGNCWFLSAVASLCASANMCGHKKLLTNVVPDDNSFTRDYAGIVHFRFWQYGKWVDVCIDDRLPTSGGQLVFMHSADSNEFWSALLEKAYAKLNGNYEAMIGGNSAEAFVDFTGGLCEVFNTRKEIPKNFHQILSKAFKRRSLMGCTIDADAGSIEAVMPNGLIMGHAYSITGVNSLNVNGRQVDLVRVRNPWGNQYEWKGAWGDSSPEWTNVSQADREKMGLTFEGDGEFWMTTDDLTANYTKIEVCNLTPDSPSDDAKGHWETSCQEGFWKAKVNAGGCRNFLDTFWTNPQYRVEVVDPDEDDDEDKGTLIVALMQKERRKKKAQGMGDYLTIGYSIYKLADPNVGPLDLEFFKYNAAVARSTFSNVREVCQRFKLDPGHYAIITQTFKPNEEGDFVVRICSERPNNGSPIDEETCCDDITIEQQLEELKKMKEGDPGVPISTDRHISTTTIKVEPRRRRIRAMQVTEDDVAEEREVRAIFRRTAGEDMELDAYELKSVLDSRFQTEFKLTSTGGFSLETCRSMVAMGDTDKSGKLGYEEFKKLWADLRKMKKIFYEFDKNKDFTLQSYELREALNTAGIRVSNSTFNGLVMRYADQKGSIQFDDFVLCAIRLKTMFDIFKEMKENNLASFTLDAFIQTTMYS